MSSFDLPPVSFYFEVKVGSFSSDVYFSEVLGLEMELESALEIKEGGNNSFSYSLPGRTKYADLVLKRGLVVKGSELYDWFQATINGNLDEKIITKDIAITLLNEDGNAHVKWSIRNAYPKKIGISTMNAKASGENAIMIETLTLSYSEVEREKV